MTKYKLIWVRIAPKNPDSNLGYVYAYFSEMGLRIRIEMIRKLFTPYKYIQTRKFLQKVPLHFCKARSVYVSYRLVGSRGYWMKNGFIGSEQTTITCAHIIDPVWKFFGEKYPEKKQLSFIKLSVSRTAGDWGIPLLWNLRFIFWIFKSPMILDLF